METEIALSDKILYLRTIQIFEDLTVGELAAVASVATEVTVPEGATFIKEGEPGDSMYLILEGEVSVIKQSPETGNRELELARIKSGDYFGEMALFEDLPRSATIRTRVESRLLAIDKTDFSEIVREYPQIALSICKAFCQRIRELHVKINTCDFNDLSSVDPSVQSKNDEGKY